MRFLYETRWLLIILTRMKELHSKQAPKENQAFNLENCLDMNNINQINPFLCSPFPTLRYSLLIGELTGYE